MGRDIDGPAQHTTMREDREGAPTQRPRAPPKPPLPPPLTTRAGNRTAHPGAIAAPAARRSSQAVRAERAQQELERSASQAQQVAAIARVAAIEDALTVEDLQYDTVSSAPPQPQVPQRRAARKRPVAAPSTEHEAGMELGNELSASLSGNNQGQ